MKHSWHLHQSSELNKTLETAREDLLKSRDAAVDILKNDQGNAGKEIDSVKGAMTDQLKMEGSNGIDRVKNEEDVQIDRLRTVTTQKLAHVEKAVGSVAAFVPGSQFSCRSSPYGAVIAAENDVLLPVRRWTLTCFDWIPSRPSRGIRSSKSDGNCRLMGPFVEQLSETVPTWAARGTEVPL